MLLPLGNYMAKATYKILPEIAEETPTEMHLQYLNDVDCICGQSWAGEQVKYPDLPEFAPLGEFRYPEYDVKKDFRALYHAGRPVTPCPEIPRPYETFADTFSYGV